MNPRQLKERLERIVTAGIRDAVMIWGAPGLGKSSIVAQVAEARGMALIDLRLSQLAPTDLRGLPTVNGDRAEWKPPEFLPKANHAQGGIFFLDEINMAPPAMQGVAQQAVLDRRVGTYEFPDNWFIWAAGNRAEDRAAVFQLSSAIANRFIHFEVTPCLDSFRQWGCGTGNLHEDVLGFLSFRTELLHKMANDSPNWPSPRTWEMASRLHQAGLGIAPAVGEGVASEFDTYRRYLEELPNLPTILEGKSRAKFPVEPSLRYACVVGLATRAQNSSAILNAFRWLLAAADAEWPQLFVTLTLDQVKQRELRGVLSKLLQAEPRVRDFLRRYRQWEQAHDA